MTEHHGYEVFRSSYHGDGIVATQPFYSDDTVFTETPFFFLQALPNRQLALTCTHCSRFIGSVGLQMKFLQKDVSRQQLSEGGSHVEGIKEYLPLSDVIPCQHKCGELYCSARCQEAHWAGGHCLLCTGKLTEEESEESALYQLKVFIVQSNEIFLMISDIVAEYICRHDSIAAAQSISHRPDSLAVFQQYVRNIWWEAINLPKQPNKRKQLQKTLQNLVAGLWDNLNDTFQLKERGLDSIFSKEWIAR